MRKLILPVGGRVSKCCSKCKFTKLVSEFCRAASEPDGFRYECRLCSSEYAKLWKFNNREKALASSRRNQWPREKHNRWKRENYKKHRQRYLGKIREWKLKNKEKAKAAYTRWHKAHPERKSESEHKRRAAKIRTISVDCTKVILELRQKCRQCFWCGCALIKANFSIDHVVPLSRGGHHAPENIVAACRSCNFRKGQKLPNEWRIVA